MKKNDKIKILEDLEELEKHSIPGKYLIVVKYPDGRNAISIEGQEKEVTEQELELFKKYNDTIILRMHTGDDRL